MVAVVGAGFSLWGAYQEWGADPLSVVVKDAAALEARGSKLHDEAGPQYEALVGTLNDFPGDRAAREGRVGELGELYRDSAEHYSEAARQWDRAWVKASDRDVKEYFLLKLQRCSKCAEIQGLLRKSVLSVADASIHTSAELRARQAELDAQIRALERSATRLDEQSAKIFAEIRPKFLKRPVARHRALAGLAAGR
jgi:hypothetical protein